MAIMRWAAGNGLAFLIKVVATSRWLTEGGFDGLAPGSPAAFDEGAQLARLGKLRH